MNYFLFFFIFCSVAIAHENPQESKWDYGVGFGVVHFEQYPSSDEFTTLALPVPTFEYRGEILYADDREGVQVFFFKSEKVKIEFSGFGIPPLDSSENDDRAGMKDLPLVLALGPQVNIKLSEHFDFGVLVAQGLDLTGERQAVSGPAMQTRLTFNFENQNSFFPNVQFFNRFFLTSRWGTKKFLKNYYEVQAQDVTANRNLFKTKEGLLSHELGYLIQGNYRQWNTYFGWALNDYSTSANRKSPLHKSNQSLTFFVGLNYILGHSEP
jgi:outer membrane scaffolding protein for murein synthesis (MipA/OmpV family)